MTTQIKTVEEKPYHHGDLRQSLIEAAWEILEAKNADSLSLREVARRAGVSHTAPYRHFEDKAALLAAVAEVALIEFKQSLQAATAQVGKDTIECLQLTSIAYVRYALEHLNQYRLMFNAVSLDLVDNSVAQSSGLSERLETMSHCAFQILVDIILVGQSMGQFRAGNAITLAFGQWALLHGLAMLVIEKRLHVKEDEVLTLINTLIINSTIGLTPTA